MSQAIDKISERGAEEGMGGGGMLPFSLQVRVLNPNKTYQGLPSPARLIETAAKKKRHSNHRKSRFRVSMISSEHASTLISRWLASLALEPWHMAPIIL